MSSIWISGGIQPKTTLIPSRTLLKQSQTKCWRILLLEPISETKFLIFYIPEWRFMKFTANQNNLDTINWYFLIFSLSTSYWLITGFSSSSCSWLLYNLQIENVFSAAFGVMYLYILELWFPSSFMTFEFTGISDSDLFVNLNFVVLLRRDLALNRLTADFLPSSVASSSLIWDVPWTAFLYSDNTSFLFLYNFFVLFN